MSYNLLGSAVTLETLITLYEYNMATEVSDALTVEFILEDK